MSPKQFTIRNLPSAKPAAAGSGNNNNTGSAVSNPYDGVSVTRVSEVALSPAALTGGASPTFPTSSGAMFTALAASAAAAASATGGGTTPPRVQSPGDDGGEAAGKRSAADANLRSFSASSSLGPTPTRPTRESTTDGGSFSVNSTIGGAGSSRVIAKLDYTNMMQRPPTGSSSCGEPETPMCAAVTPIHGVGTPADGGLSSSSHCSAAASQQHQPSSSSLSQPQRHWLKGAIHKLAANVRRVALEQPGTFHVIKTVACPFRAAREFDHYNTAPMHPSVLRYLKFRRFDNGSAEVTMEYANRGTLSSIVAELNDVLSSPVAIGAGTAVKTVPRAAAAGVRADGEKQRCSDSVGLTGGGGAGGRFDSSSSNDADSPENPNLKKEEAAAAAVTKTPEELAEARQKQTVREQFAKAVARQVLEALLYYERVHRRWHRDIKGDNVLCRSDGVLKLSDFDVSRQASGTVAGGRTCTGTPDYMAPDYLRAAASLDYVVDAGKADVWSVGCMLCHIVFGKVPFARRNVLEPVLPETVAAAHQTMLARVQDPQLRALLRRCLNWHSENRACLGEAAAMTYFFFCDPATAKTTTAGEDPLIPSSDAAAAAAAQSSTSSTSSCPCPSLSAACEQCVKLCDCTADTCRRNIASPLRDAAALDQYGADLGVHPLADMGKCKEAETGDEQRQQPQQQVTPQQRLAMAIHCMQQALFAELDTMKQCMDAKKLHDLPLQQTPRSSPPTVTPAAVALSVSSIAPVPDASVSCSSPPARIGSVQSMANTAPTHSLELALDQLSATSTTTTTTTAATSGSDDSAAPAATATTEMKSQIRKEEKGEAEAAAAPSSLSCCCCPSSQSHGKELVYSPVCPGMPAVKMSTSEQAQFQQRFVDFAQRFRLPLKTAERAFDANKHKDMTEEEIVAKAVRSCVSEEMRRHWGERSRPVYSAVKDLLRRLDAESMRSTAGGPSFSVVVE